MWCVLSVYDIKAQEYGQLYLARTEQVGARMFADAVLGGPEDSTLRRYPEDFVLRCVGGFDEGSGELSPEEQPYDVVKAVDVILAQRGVEKPGDWHSANDGGTRYDEVLNAH